MQLDYILTCSHYDVQICAKEDPTLSELSETVVVFLLTPYEPYLLY